RGGCAEQVRNRLASRVVIEVVWEKPKPLLITEEKVDQSMQKFRAGESPRGDIDKFHAIARGQVDQFIEREILFETAQRLGAAVAIDSQALQQFEILLPD